MILTRIEYRDTENLLRMRNLPEIYRMCRQFDLLHESNHANWINAQAKNPSISMYAIREHQEGDAIGVCGLTDIDLINRRAEFSLYIDPMMQGRGIGLIALGKLLEKGFNSYNLNTIWGETFDGNPAISTFEKLGFVKEGTRRQFYFREGRYIDAHLYSISREEWIQQPSS